MDLEPSHLLGQGLGDDKYLDVEAVEEISQTVNPARSQQEGPRRVASFASAPDDLGALCDKQPMLSLQRLAQVDVTQVHVVSQSWVGGIVDIDERCHRSNLPVTIVDR